MTNFGLNCILNRVVQEFDKSLSHSIVRRYRRLNYKTSNFRNLEFLSIIIYPILLFKHQNMPQELQVQLPLIFEILLAVVFCDFVSGLVHWFADTYGSESTPIIGKSLIGPFRNHHLFPSSITEHDFIETNGSTFLLANCWLGISILLSIPSTFSALSSILIAFTNQFHKWAHLDIEPKSLQAHRTQLFRSSFVRRFLPLSGDHHRNHHQGDHLQGYCITFGVLNPLLDRLKFFRLMEKFIKRLSGVSPRAADHPISLSSGSAAKN